MIRNLKISAVAGGAVLLSVATAQAGGFSRGTADTDILFEPGNFAARAGVTYVSPSRKYNKAPNSDLVGTNHFQGYVIPSVAAKYRMSDNFSCAGTYTTPFGASGKYAGRGLGVVGGSPRKLEEVFIVHEFGLTCGVNFQMGSGNLWLLGGGYVDKFDYSLDFVTAPGAGSVNAKIKLDDTKAGYRLGLAYEVPDIALRGQLLYRSGAKLSPDGDLTTPAGTSAATGAGRTPQSVELKLQSGIAPGWLAFGSVKWTDWSVNQTLDVTAGGSTTQNQYYWRDGWTVTGGVGHAFNDKLSGSLSFTWDRGVGTGWDTMSTTYSAAIGGSYKNDLGGEFRAGVGLGRLTSATETKKTPAVANAAVDSGWAVAVSASYKHAF